MKDKQISPSSAEPRIFFVSAFLHCVSMTVLVFLRSSFGFAFLRPKSVFFAFSWALILYAVYAWIEGAVWQQKRAVLLFGIAAIILYWTHFLIAFIREWNQTGEHDNHSGTSHPVRLMRRAGQTPRERFEARLHLWGEPGMVLAAAVTLRLVFGERTLSLWFFLAALCLWSKEALNYWFSVRQRKRQKDLFDDTGDTVEPPATSNLAAEKPRATRKAKIQRTRNDVNKV